MITTVKYTEHVKHIRTKNKQTNKKKSGLTFIKGFKKTILS